MPKGVPIYLMLKTEVYFVSNLYFTDNVAFSCSSSRGKHCWKCLIAWPRVLSSFYRFKLPTTFCSVILRDLAQSASVVGRSNTEV